MKLRVGSLFSGYEGLGMGVQSALGGDLAWVSDIDKGACKILAHRFPDVPNLGDITAVDWSAVEPVDVLTGGFPCQDVSAAGKRAGIRPGTRSGLWTHFAYAISQLRPSLVVIENVRGLLSAEAHRDVEPDEEALGDGSGEPVLRALGAVLGDLADLGYDAAWCGLRASDVGAPHGRFRVFVLAWPTNTEGEQGRVEHRDGQPERHGRGQDRRSVGHLDSKDEGRARQRQRQRTRRIAQHRGPGSSRHIMNCGWNDEEHEPHDWTTFADTAKWCTGWPHADLPAQALLPTPGVVDAAGGPKRLVDGSRTEADHGPALRDVAGAFEVQWGRYAAAIARWENATRPAPAPTETSAKGTPRLSARFSEWLMGPPAGWITDVPGITRNEALKACGNGVVPQQAAKALRRLLPFVPMPILDALAVAA